MAQFPNARISFGQVLDAIEDKLLLDHVVADRSSISWGLPDQIPQLSGPFDLLLVARNGTNEPRDGGPAQLQILRYVDIWYRSQAIADAGGGYKEFIKSVFVGGDQIIASVAHGNWWPEDKDGNLLTIESCKLIGDVPPDYMKPGSAHGTYVATISCLYFPAINPETIRAC